MKEVLKGKIIRKNLGKGGWNEYAIYVLRTEKRDHQISLLKTTYQIGDTLEFWKDGNGDHAVLIKAHED